MIECPNCGMMNAPNRAHCAVCGERLPQSEPSGAPDTVPPPQVDRGEDLDWLMEEPAPTPPPAPSPTPPPPAPRPVATSSHLPSWLQGVEIEPEAPLELPDEWDEALDFSDLPEWRNPEDEAAIAREAELVEPFSPQDPFHAVESEGSGLLSGVRGPIPIEPIIRVPHEAPLFPTQNEPTDQDEGANLFARIAGGAVLPEPVRLPEAPPRGAILFHLLLVLAVTLPLALQLSLFGAPPPLPAALDYAGTIEALPSEGTVLLAFDYEGGMRDELEPAAIATINHLRQAGGGPGGLALLAVSTTPQGTALAARAWEASEGPEIPWELEPFLPGGTMALRSLLATRFEPGGARAPIALVIVFGNETLDVQRWIEQVGSQRTLPMLAAVPATAETTLTPYLSSGQLDGLLAGTVGTASYEYHGSGQLGIAWRRVDAITLGALLLLLVIVAGNLAALVQRRT